MKHFSECVGNMWDMNEPSWPTINGIVITTNGFVKSNGLAVCGRGCAKEATERVLDFASLLGFHLQTKGNHVGLIAIYEGDKQLISFPVKPAQAVCLTNKSNIVHHMQSRFHPGDTVPGWACVADINLIEQSCKELVQMVNANYRWNQIRMPRPGCGAGELEWATIKPIFEKYLDERFTIYHK